jgi:hypothetical protein
VNVAQQWLQSSAKTPFPATQIERAVDITPPEPTTEAQSAGSDVAWHTSPGIDNSSGQPNPSPAPNSVDQFENR